MFSQLSRFILVLLLISLPLISFAQGNGNHAGGGNNGNGGGNNGGNNGNHAGGGNNGNGGGNGGGAANGVPLDGGLSLLVASGVGYGIKRVVANRKKSQAA